MSAGRDGSPIEDHNIEIREVPDINEYEDIIKAAKTGRLIVFVGAGVSKLIGLPLWNEFALKKLDEIFELGWIDYRTYCDLKKEGPKKILTICKMFADEKKIHLRPAKEIFEIKNYRKYKEVYDKLYSMKAIFVTTNYDECLDNFALNNVKYDDNIVSEGSSCSDDSNRMTVNLNSPVGEVVINRSDLLESKLQNGNVIHIHGSVSDEKNMIVTLDDYMLHYGSLSKDNYPELSTFLYRIFNKKYVVLFIGYGLEEFELLEYMLSKVKKYSEKARKHYLLYPCFKENVKLISLLKKYYLSFGVELIPYDIGKRGYDQLVTILDEWSKILNKVSNEQDYIQKMQFIDEVIEDIDTSFNVNARAVIEMAKKDESLEIYLFRKISDIRWLDLLIENGFYKPEKVPKVVDKGDGWYSSPYWVQTDYLNKLVINEDNLNEEIIGKVLNIIQTISLYRDSEGNSIDNWQVWAQFIEIINKIPNEYITSEILRLTRLWANSRFNKDFVVEKIGETLLEKFLSSDNPDDFKKAQIIIEIVTALKTDGEELVIGNYFWELFDEKIIESISRKCSMDFLESYINRVKEALFKRVNRNTFIYDNKKLLIKLEDNKQKYIVSILHANEEDLLNTIFLNQSDSEYVVLFVKEFIHCSDDDFTQYVLEWLNEIFDGSKFNNNNMRGIVRSLYYGFYSKGSYHSLYRSPNKYTGDAAESLLYFYKEIVTKKFQIEVVAEEKIIFINKLLNSKYFALIKVALYVIGNLPDKYLTVFWRNLDSEIMQLIFQESYFGDELRVVLESINQIDNEHASKLLNLIESGPYSKYYGLDFDEMYEKAWKVRRLNALRHIPYFNEYITNNFQGADSNVKLGPVIGEVETFGGPEKSPLSQNDLSNMANEEISDFLSIFRTKNRWKGPTVEGLGNALKQHVKNNPEKYDSNLIPFINSAYYYVYEIFYGLLDAHRQARPINWDHIIEFMFRYINRNEFWEDTFVINDDGWDANHYWVIGVFAELICKGTNEDKCAMKHDQVIKSKNIVITILNKIINYFEENTYNDYITYVLNSIKGKALKALLCISLYLKRNSSKDTKWDNDLRTMFIKYMDTGILDAYVLFGEYLPQFLYLDEQWSTETVNGIKYESDNWEGFMAGYLYSGTIYKDIYLLMKNHYKHSIYHTFNEEKVIENLAQHIAIGYFEGSEEEINNELFDSVLEKWDYSMINHILRYFWTYGDKLGCHRNDNKEEIRSQDTEKKRQRIVGFWDRLYRKYKDIDVTELNNDDKKLISDSIKLIEILDNLDEKSVQRLRFAVKYADVNYNARYFIKKIIQFVSDNDCVEKRLIIGELLIDLVKYNVPTYPKEEIRKLVKYLYQIENDNLKDCADRISNIYAMNNIEFLRDICQEYRDY